MLSLWFWDVFHVYQLLASGMQLLRTGIFSTGALPKGTCSPGQTESSHKLVGFQKIQYAALWGSLKSSRLLLFKNMLFKQNNQKNKKRILNRGDFDS